MNLSGVEAPGSHMCQVDEDLDLTELARLLNETTLLHSGGDGDVLSGSEDDGAAPSAAQAMVR